MKGFLGFIVAALLAMPAPALATNGMECSALDGAFRICASTTSIWSSGWDNDWSNWFDDRDDDWDNDWDDWFDEWDNDWDDWFDDEWDDDFEDLFDDWFDKDHDHGSHGDDDSYGCGAKSHHGYNSCEVVPEPITTVLLGTGLFGVGGAALRRRRRGDGIVHDED